MNYLRRLHSLFILVFASILFAASFGWCEEQKDRPEKWATKIELPGLLNLHMTDDGYNFHAVWINLPVLVKNLDVEKIRGALNKK